MGHFALPDPPHHRVSPIRCFRGTIRTPRVHLAGKGLSVSKHCRKPIQISESKVDQPKAHPSEARVSELTRLLTGIRLARVNGGSRSREASLSTYELVLAGEEAWRDGNIAN